ncbi:GntR family transcriptional regulator [Bosea sp. BK604]|uniref:GntR family transcriptional regulator n=1 Tax=Bosea sp. BK604 TaxID=2512180 RepID=UPI0010E75CAB|nr:GntR family transcriptional regulator [Bosea sp. BK604]TCR62507.1 DNA-binding GntR family transcriptional regulator [Bosea sp. BK604]
MTTTDNDNGRQPTRLQEELAGRIMDLARADGAVPGDRLNEKILAERLSVSRSPVRAALDLLAARGLVIRRPQRGVELLAALPGEAAASGERAGDDDLLVRIAADRDYGNLGDDVSETELMQRYGVVRAVVRRALDLLADMQMVERKPGYGWRFLTSWSAELRRDSYRFRLVIEPAAILEPGFALRPGFAEEMRRLHDDSLSLPWSETSSVAFFEMNAAFHEGIAEASGNRFLLEAMRRQNRLRRFSIYNWKHGFDRVRANYAEHMEILAKLEAGDVEFAALLMRRHLEIAGNMNPSAAK